MKNTLKKIQGKAKSWRLLIQVFCQEERESEWEWEREESKIGWMEMNSNDFVKWKKKTFSFLMVIFFFFFYPKILKYLFRITTILVMLFFLIWTFQISLISTRTIFFSQKPKPFFFLKEKENFPLRVCIISFEFLFKPITALKSSKKYLWVFFHP